MAHCCYSRSLKTPDFTVFKMGPSGKLHGFHKILIEKRHLANYKVTLETIKTAKRRNEKEYLTSVELNKNSPVKKFRWLKCAYLINDVIPQVIRGRGGEERLLTQGWSHVRFCAATLFCCPSPPNIQNLRPISFIHLFNNSKYFGVLILLAPR